MDLADLAAEGLDKLEPAEPDCSRREAAAEPAGEEWGLRWEERIE